MKRTILFQGDSITDCGRKDTEDNLGNGYVRLIAEHLAVTEPDAVVVNRGIYGNRSDHLRARWQEDCLNLFPHCLTVLIGTNDCWEKIDYNRAFSLEEFGQTYDSMLKEAVEGGVRELVLMEPFVLPHPPERLAWRDTLDKQISVVRTLALQYGARLVPLDGLFAQAACCHDFHELTEDGVHPTAQGHRLIADAWLEAVRSCS